MRRRLFLSGLGCFGAWPLTAHGQRRPDRIYHVGLIAPGHVGPNDERLTTLLRRLAAHGFVLGRNLALDIRSGDGRFERLSELATALKTSKVDVIVTFGYPAALAAKTSADGIPVVVSGSGDPVATGLAESLSRPGGNVTGMTEMSTELSAKRLEILKEAVPDLNRVAMLWNAADQGMTLRYRAAETAAKVLGISVQTLGVREPDDFADAFAAMTQSPPDAILMVSDALTMLNRRRVIEFATANRLPAIYELSSLVRDGGLMSYGPNNNAVGERVGEFVVRILQGARPADLPLEQPTKLEFLINLKTARSLDLKLSPLLIARADEVIE